MPPPTIAMAGSMPSSASPMCIEPPLPVTAARALGKQFRHQEFHRDPARHGVLVRSVRAGQHVAFLKRLTDSNGTGFLPLRLMDRSRHSALQKERVHPIFKHPAEQHLAVHAQLLFLCQERSSS